MFRVSDQGPARSRYHKWRKETRFLLHVSVSWQASMVRCIHPAVRVQGRLVERDCQAIPIPYLTIPYLIEPLPEQIMILVAVRDEPTNLCALDAGLMSEGVAEEPSYPGMQPNVASQRCWPSICVHQQRGRDWFKPRDYPYSLQLMHLGFLVGVFPAIAATYLLTRLRVGDL